MTQSGRELVRMALDFKGPGRIPLAKGADAHVGIVGFGPPAGWEPPQPGHTEWGSGWRSFNRDKGDQGQAVLHPLADWASFRSYRFPDPDAPGRLDGLPDLLAVLRREGKFVFGSLGKGPMHLLDELRGFEGYLVDIAIHPGRTEAMLDGIFHFLCGMVRRFAAGGVDGVFLLDDQAAQSGPLFSMDLWRRHLGPRYADLFGLAHRAGLKVWMHACGRLDEHLEDLCEVGVDLLDNKQPELWIGCPALEAVRGRISFSSCIDIQKTLPAIPLEDIPAAADRLVRRLGTPQGGFLGTFYHQQDLGIPPRKTAAMMQAFREFRW